MYSARKHNGRVLTNTYVEAYMQLDTNAPPGFYPQVTLLDELHEEAPESTFVMAFRPIFDWMRSLEHHFGMRRRYASFQLPGMQNDHVMTLGERNYTQKKKVITDSQLARFWCGHVKHIRAYAREYPSHKLIEVDLYDSNTTSELMTQLFGIPGENGHVDGSSKSCWGHSNSVNDREKIVKHQKKATRREGKARGGIEKEHGKKRKQ